MARSKHDPFFSKSMEHPAIAKAFFRQHLPPHILPLVDFDTFTRVDRINTDQQLKQRHRDIAYQGQMGGKYTLFACAEHQSTPDFMMPMRCLYYGADLASPYFKQHKKMPLVVTIVFYQGKQSPYPYPTRLEEYYEYPAWGIQELSLRFLVVDSQQLSDEALLKHGLCAPMELLLKHGRDGNFELTADAYHSIFQDCIAAVGDEYIFTMLTYATELSDQEVGKRIYEFIEAILSEKKDIIMTYRQVLENRGEVRGMEKGMEKGMETKSLEIAKNMLFQLHLGMDVVQKATGLNKEELAQLANQAH